MESNKIRIIFLLPNLCIGGAEKVMFYIGTHLSEEEFDVHFVVLSIGDNPIPGIEEKNVQIHELGLDSARLAILKLRSRIAELKPDIVISSVIQMNFLLAIFRPIYLKKPSYIIRESTIPSLRFHRYNKKLYRYVYTKLFPRMDKIICLSESMQNDLIEEFGIPQDKVVTIQNPIMQVNDLKSNYSFKKGLIVYLGGLHAHKQVDILIQALKYLDSYVSLRIIGDGVERDSLEQLVKTLGLTDRVEFVGYKQKPRMHLEEANILVLPSKYEGFGNVLVEALSYGIPVVAFRDAGASKDIISHEVNGVLVDEMNPKELALGVSKAIDIEWERYSIAENAAKVFNPKKICLRYEDIFRELMSQ